MMRLRLVGLHETRSVNKFGELLKKNIEKNYGFVYNVISGTLERRENDAV